MGLKGFSLATSGAIELRSIPAWSTQHFEATGRPLRIAVDQASWWYRNITAQKDAEMEQQTPGSHPREKRIMERIFYLLKMNIQLLFVFDDREQARIPASHAYSKASVQLLKDLLDRLGVPRHDAPGPAEAECARLQDLGVVDAIWTDETEILIYSSQPTIVDFQKPEGEQFKSSSTVLISNGDRIKERTSLSKEGFLMRSILLGHDDRETKEGIVTGLEGFTTNQFNTIVRHRTFESAARMLASAVDNPNLLGKWRALFTCMVKDVSANRNFTAPPRTFPDLAVLSRLARPIVSLDEVLLDLPCLKPGWFRTYGTGMLERYRFLLQNFNSQIHESWIARDLVPIELNARLQQRDYHLGVSTQQQSLSPAEQVANSRRYKIRPARRRRKERVDTTTITINPLDVLPELRTAFPMDVQRNGRRVLLQTPTFRAEDVELLDCVLRCGLPEAEVKKLTAPPATFIQKQKHNHNHQRKHVRKRSSFPLSLAEQQGVIATKPKPVPPPLVRPNPFAGTGSSSQPFRTWTAFERRGSVPIAEIKRSMGLEHLSEETPPPVPPLPLHLIERRGSAPMAEIQKGINGTNDAIGQGARGLGETRGEPINMSRLQVPITINPFERRGSMPAPPVTKPMGLGLHLTVPTPRRVSSSAATTTTTATTTITITSTTDFANDKTDGDNSPITPISPLSPASPLFTGDLTLPGDLCWGLDDFGHNGDNYGAGEGEFVSAWHTLAPANPLSRTASRLAKRMSLQRKSPLPSPLPLSGGGLLLVKETNTTPPPTVVFNAPDWNVKDEVPSPVVELVV
ncbi:hypothetical protein F5Y16DRAFT_29392 [Xylariaceae sp. FL0255]|nr:hypothetical protein F5Y16DRAFT_29392 [Xylariaceae sp. FL0255]